MSQLDALIVKVDDRLANPGDMLSLNGHIDQKSFSLGDHDFTLPKGIDYDLVLTNAGEGILVTGIVKAQADGVCDRCLDPAHLDLSGEVDEYFLFEEPQKVYEDEADEEEGVDFSLVSDDETIDVADAVLAALLMETPYIVLCREDCKGLCPTCGTNLNEEDCGCAATREEQQILEGPFAALGTLDLND
ncbi:YceD family protein [Atopobium fossor]|uniref:YceD family protein n=1 Tax=Atopobium fossor TaxID=39487 RepID=UPI00040B4B12|nr:DUF177 domain-containing protein [Atopobium fossor]